MRKLLFAVLFCSTLNASGAEVYHFFVQFHDKLLNYSSLDQAHTYLSERSLERRKRLGIKLDSTDLPVSQGYIINIVKPSIHVDYVSKWLNGAVISTLEPDSAFNLKIKFFVDDVVYLGKTQETTWQSGNQSELVNKDTFGLGWNQVHMMQGEQLHLNGYTGKSMRIAVLDAGFKRMNKLSLFKHLYDNQKIVYTNDLVDKESDVYDDDDHGLHVIGCMAANKSGTMVGTAPDAEYVLIRTEANRYENLLEELHWVRAAEIADSLGVDVINSSLGYNHFDEKRLNHTHDELDGKSAYISRGADFAVTRGILVVNSAGNDGNKAWGKLDFPADAELPLIVGAMRDNMEVTSFSSPGPTSDMRIKPDIAALGHQVTIATTYGTGTGNGTSYSTPIVTGLATCLWEADPSLTPQQIKKLIIHSSHLFNTPDYSVGHGLPDFNLALKMIGKHPNMDYSKPQVVNREQELDGDQIQYDVYVPNSQYVSFLIYQKKRFLIFKYRKKLESGELNLYRGFAKIDIQSLDDYGKKNTAIEFRYSNAQGDQHVFESISIKR